MNVRSPSRTLALLACATIVILGGYLRFAHLQTKLFWGDETYTALRVSGQTQAQLDTLSDGTARPLHALAAFQREHRASSPAATANSLAVDEPQHPPLFFVAERLWADVFGSSPAALRALSALAGLLGLPAMFWLCMELFGRRAYAYAGTALAAVSPFFVTYAHEAREYAAWGTITLVATAALLAARRGRRWWIVYAVSIAASLYLDMLTVWVVAAHAVAVAVSFPQRARSLTAFAAAAGAAIVAYIPWIAAFIQHRSVVAEGLNWADGSMSPVLYLGKLCFAASTVFFDLSFVSMLWLPVAALVGALSIAALVVTARGAPLPARVTILALAFTPSIVFVVQDALTHSYYATAARYQVPTLIALELAVTYAFVQALHRAPVAARGAFAVLLLAGCVSSLTGNTRTIWWDNHSDAEVPGIARAVDDAVNPIVLSEHARLPKLLALSHALKPDTRFALFWKADGRISGVSARETAAFVLEPSSELLQRLNASGCRATRVDIDSAATATADNVHRHVLAQQGRADSGLWTLAPCSSLSKLAELP